MSEYNKDHEAHLESEETEANDKRYENSISNTEGVMAVAGYYLQCDICPTVGSELYVKGDLAACQDCANTHDEHGDKL
jgi:hypothetical protein